MIDDSKRREVARRLREIDVDSIGHGYELLEEVADCIGDEGVKYGAYERFAVLLADLIEPSGHGCVPGECPLNVRHDNDRIDRDALLELADDLDRMGDGSMYDPCISDEYGIARRIREALGVDE